MALRFRRTFTIFPGVRLNVGKSGVSLSLGRPGSSMTVNRSGIHTNVGAPGTGLSYRKKLVSFAADKKVDEADMLDQESEGQSMSKNTKDRTQDSLNRLNLKK